LTLFRLGDFPDGRFTSHPCCLHRLGAINSMQPEVITTERAGELPGLWL
jgi:hypothetical protein